MTDFTESRLPTHQMTIPLRATTAVKTIAIAIAVLGLIGFAVSRAVHGNPIYWATALMVTGALLSAAGVLLHVT